MQALIQQLESTQAGLMQQALAQLPAQVATPPLLAVCAVGYHRWDPQAIAPQARRFTQFQANRLGWRLIDDWGPAPRIRAALEQFGRSAMGEAWEGLLSAARFFNYAYPVEVELGNGTTGGYVMDCQQLWREFAPYRTWFAQALAWAPALQLEWITLAQICWYHFRWQPDGPGGTFCEPACAYLLARAVEQTPPLAVQYYYFYQRLAARRWDPASPAQELVLQSPGGLTHFFYAQFCQYHLEDYPAALAAYRYFLEAEPACLPDNRLELLSRDATQRSYPPSTQEALTQLGTILFQTGEPLQAEHLLEQAIAQRPGNVQAPYEQLAAVRRQAGDERGALALLAKKAEACLQTLIEQTGSPRPVRVYVAYDPSQTERQVLSNLQWPAAATGDALTRLRQQPVEALYGLLAEAYLYELLDYGLASVYYRKYAAYLLDSLTRAQQQMSDLADPAHWAGRSPATRRRLLASLDAQANQWRDQLAATYASQIRLSVDQRDYWQGRSLARKLLALMPGHGLATRYLALIEQRLGY